MPDLFLLLSIAGVLGAFFGILACVTGILPRPRLRKPAPEPDEHEDLTK